MAKINPPIGFRTLVNALEYSLPVRINNRRFGRKKPRGRFKPLGKVVNIEPQSWGARIYTEHGAVEIAFLSPEIVRVRMRADTDFLPPFSYAVIPSVWPPVTIQYDEKLTLFTLQTDQITCRVNQDPCRLVFETADGRVISEDEAGMAWREHEVRWARRLPSSEGCYGLGLRADSLNLRGKRLSLWNTDPRPYQRGIDPIYTSIPFYLGVQPDRVYGILWDNPARGYVDLGAEHQDLMTFFAEDGELRFYLFVGQDVPAVLKHYTALAGRMPLPPLWALGFHQSRWSYESEKVFRRLAQEFRQRRLPCDALYFDIDYMDGFRCFTWNKKRFPLLPELLNDLSQQGFKAVAILDPGVKVDSRYPVYKDGIREDVFLKYPNGKRATAPVWPGKCHFPDFTSARVRAWWADKINVLTQAGFSGIWNDMNEPAVLSLKAGQTLPDYVIHDGDGSRLTHVQGGHNVYGMLMARATREGVQKQQPDKRPFVMTRAAYAGVQRYASSWTGDNLSTWDHLRLSISMVLNMGLSGLAFTGPDVGGFAGEPDGELFTRWVQLGSMLPYFRIHTMIGTAPQEPWSYGEFTEAIIRQTLELRYQMLPYLYSAFAQCAQDGIPIVRPLLMADPDNTHLYSRDDEFLLGDSILVAPVLEQGAVKREVYLPRGKWYEFRTGNLVDGDRTLTVSAPLDTLPLYVRAGRVIPLWPVMQYVGERPLDELRLRVYAGTGESTLYEDEGEGLAYQKGDYCWSYFTCRLMPTGQFAIDWRRAGSYSPSYRQIRVEIMGLRGEPESIELDGQGAPVWYYEGDLIEMVIVKPFNEARIIGCSTSPEAEQVQKGPPRE